MDTSNSTTDDKAPAKNNMTMVTLTTTHNYTIGVKLSSSHKSLIDFLSNNPIHLVKPSGNDVILNTNQQRRDYDGANLDYASAIKAFLPSYTRLGDDIKAKKGFAENFITSFVDNNHCRFLLQLESDNGSLFVVAPLDHVKGNLMKRFRAAKHQQTESYKKQAPQRASTQKRNDRKRKTNDPANEALTAQRKNKKYKAKRDNAEMAESALTSALTTALTTTLTSLSKDSAAMFQNTENKKYDAFAQLLSPNSSTTNNKVFSTSSSKCNAPSPSDEEDGEVFDDEEYPDEKDKVCTQVEQPPSPSSKELDNPFLTPAKRSPPSSQIFSRPSIHHSSGKKKYQQSLISPPEIDFNKPIDVSNNKYHPAIRMYERGIDLNTVKRTRVIHR